MLIVRIWISAVIDLEPVRRERQLGSSAVWRAPRQLLGLFGDPGFAEVDDAGRPVTELRRELLA